MKALRCMIAGLATGLVTACVAARPESTEQLRHWAGEHGYYMAQFEGQVVYCQELMPPNTRISQTECITEKVLADRKYHWEHRNLHPGGPYQNN
ncbi:MAG TPA: hypothetical protein VF851_11105 [Steroidobacteraceae bacterium]